MPIGGNITGGGGGGGGSCWEVVGDWDWTTEPGHTFADGVPEAFQTIDFTSRNTANAGTLAVDLTGQGLQIGMTAAESSSRYWNENQTGPVVFATLSDIVSGYSLRDTIVIQCVMDATFDTIQGDGNAGNQHTFGGIMVSDGGYGDPGGGNWYSASSYRGLGSTDNYYYTRYGGGTTPSGGDNDLLQLTGGGVPGFMELVIYPGTAWSSAMSLDTEVQPPFSVSSGVSFGNMQTTLPKDIGSSPPSVGQTPGVDPDFTLRPGNIKVGMWGAYLTTGGTRLSAVTFAFKRFRVLRRLE